MAAELIGPARCPFCSGRARLTLSKNRLPVLTCNGCQVQAFARSDRSDSLFRSLLVKEEAPAAAPAEPVRTEPATPKPAPPAVRTAPAPEPVRPAAPASPFDFMGWTR